jgi:5'-methylthioadenosine phosphorylase
MSTQHPAPTSAAPTSAAPTVEAPDAETPDAEAPTIGIIGGSGLYSLADDLDEVFVDTPYGSPSDALMVGTVAGRRVAFLPRHGRHHQFPPHRINYRANMWALRALGVRQVVAPCAVGGLRADLGPGTLVVPDQFVDRTTGRVQTFYDQAAVHVSAADPYCPNGRSVVLTAARSARWSPLDGATLVVIEGPRFSTRAESRWFSTNGWEIVGMTGHPEAVLARELALCYTTVALVTDLDAGMEHGAGVSHAAVLEVFARNVARVRSLLVDVIPALPAERTCSCPAALDGLKLPFELP